MKKIVNGKRYDTDTAKCLASDSYSNSRDFNHWTETLYRKSSGEFFLHGEGGPMSRYAQTIGQNQWSGGEKIIPLTLEAAQQWAEEHLDGDDYERIFGLVEETASKRTVNFSLTESAIEKIARLAQEQHITKSEVIEQLLKQA